MVRSYRKVHPPVGARPGTLAVPPGSPPPRVRVIRYDGEHAEKLDPVEPSALPTLIEPGMVTWFDVQGLGDEAVLRAIGAAFQIHPLALEDVTNVPQRPKAEEHDEHLLLITRMMQIGDDRRVHGEQMAIFVGEHYVLTFQEHYGDVLDPVRERIHEGIGPIRTGGTAYLAYALLDAVVDGYYPVLERVSEDIEQLETRILSSPKPAQLDRLNGLRLDLLQLRRALWPQRESINVLLRESWELMPERVQIYLRDTHEHCAQLVDILDTQRELVAGMLNTYLSVVGNRTNEVMKVLTIMASIFIPLTFVAGIYGMNFEYMPELHRRMGYPAVLVLMVLISGGMVLYFRHRGWIGDGDDDD